MHRRPCPDLRAIRADIEAYILPKVRVTESGCWEWQGNKNALGYAEGGFGGRTWVITRLVFCATQGDFDPQLDVCHTCDNTGCISPVHLWLGTRKQNSQDCIEKRRHYKVQNTHCPRGHSFAEHGVPYSNKPWRVCKICERARGRVRAGWPEDLAYSLPLQPLGYRPNGIGKKWARPKVSSRLRSHCKRGHALEGENIYKKPNGGRQCKICHDAAASAWIARGKVPLGRSSTAEPT